MPWSLRYALRHLRRRSRENLLLGLVFFVAALVCLAQLAQRRGVERRARQLLVEGLAGAFVLDRGAGGEPVDVLATQGDALPAFPAAPAVDRLDRAGIVASPRLRFGALLGRDERSLGVVVHAVAPAHLTRVAALLGTRAPGLDAPHGALLGDVVARQLGVRVGDTLAVLATNRSGYVSDGLVVVRGIFGTRGAAAFLTGVLFVPHADGAALLGLAPGETLELAARPAEAGADAEADARTADRLRTAAGPLRVTPWWRAAPMIAAVLTIWRGAGAMTQAVLAAVAFLLVLNAMLAKLHDRTRELGTLRALGLSVAAVTRTVALEYVGLALVAATLAAAVVAALATLAAGGVPLPGEALQAAYLGRRLYPVLLGADVLRIVALCGAVVLAATLVPLARTLRREPALLLRTRT